MTDAALLAAILAEIRGLRADLAEGRSEPPLSADDGAWLAQLLVQLAPKGDVTWTVADAIAFADSRPALFSLVEPYLDVGGSRRLGKRLARCAGRWTGDLMLERVGDAGGAALYCVRGVSKPNQTPETPARAGMRVRSPVG